MSYRKFKQFAQNLQRHIYIYIYIYIHTHIHTYIYIYFKLLQICQLPYHPLCMTHSKMGHYTDIMKAALDDSISMSWSLAFNSMLFPKLSGKFAPTIFYFMIHLFIPQMFTEYLLYSRDHSKCCGCSRKWGSLESVGSQLSGRDISRHQQTQKTTHDRW